MYFYNEHYLLPFSHDEVVHGKATNLNKMNGQYEDKFPQARAMYLYMMIHPGKKLNFMGNEIGQFREWDENREQDWNLRKYPAHDSFYTFMAELNQVYLTHSALWAEWHVPKIAPAMIIQMMLSAKIKIAGVMAMRTTAGRNTQAKPFLSMSVPAAGREKNAQAEYTRK